MESEGLIGTVAVVYGTLRDVQIDRLFPGKALPERIPLEDEQHRIMAEYESKLRKGGDPRRWFQEAKAALSKHR